MSKTKIFNSAFVYDRDCLFCHSGKIYIFHIKKLNQNENHAHLLILCTKTFTVLKNSRIKDKLNTDETLKKSNFSHFNILKTIFQDKNNLKVFMHCGQKAPILVFDISNENFYFIENTISCSVTFSEMPSQYCTDFNRNIVYEVVMLMKFQP